MKSTTNNQPSSARNEAVSLIQELRQEITYHRNEKETFQNELSEIKQQYEWLKGELKMVVDEFKFSSKQQTLTQEDHCVETLLQEKKQLQDQLNYLQDVTKYISRVECKNCRTLLKIENLSSHVPECLDKQRKIQFEVKIQGVNYLKNNGERLEIFNMQVNDIVRNQQWTVNRLMNQFKTFSQELQKKFNFTTKLESQLSNLKGKDKILTLQQFLDDCLQNEQVSNSLIFKKFIGVQDQKKHLTTTSTASSTKHSRTKSAMLSTKSSVTNKASFLNKKQVKDPITCNDQTQNVKTSLPSSMSNKNLIILTKGNTLTNNTAAQTRSINSSTYNTYNQGAMTTRNKSLNSTKNIKMRSKVPSQNRKSQQKLKEYCKQNIQTVPETDAYNTLETPSNNQFKLVIPQNILKTIHKKAKSQIKEDMKVINKEQNKQNQKQPQSVPLDSFLKEEQKKIQARRLSQEENKLDISEEVDLLSYNEYIANAKMAKKQKHLIPHSGKITPLNAIRSNTPLAQQNLEATQKITNLIQRNAKKSQKSNTPSPQELQKRYNPTVLMKSKSMKDHFKKNQRQNFYDNLMGDQQDGQDDDENNQQNKYIKPTLKKVTNRDNAKSIGVYNIRKERKTLNYRTPPSEKLNRHQFDLYSPN